MDGVDRILRALRDLYRSPWIVATEVRSWIGQDHGREDDQRRADVLRLLPRSGENAELHGHEIKLRRPDWMRERVNPAKSAPFRPVCRTWSLVVPAPRKNVVHDLGELPKGWGLLEVGAGGLVELVEPRENRDCEPLTPDLWASILRAVTRESERDGARQTIVERLHGGRVRCRRGHIVCPVEKKPQTSTACPSCAAGLPPDAEALASALGDIADEQELRELRALIDRRLDMEAAPAAE